MRECHGLVDSMIHYVNSSLEVGKSEDKVGVVGVEVLFPHPVVQRHILMSFWENQPGSLWAHWAQLVS